VAEDLAIIGAGPGGYAAAVRAAQLGAHVTLVEREAVGGTCLNWGCIPSKVMRSAAEMREQLQRAAGFGIGVKAGPEVPVDMQTLKERMERVMEDQREGIRRLLQRHRVRYLEGEARVKHPHGIEVNLKEGGVVDVPYSKLIFALGSRPLEISSLPFDGRRVLSSNDVFGLTRIPGSMVVVGGGVIGCEFAFMFRAFGAQVTVVETMSRILPLESVDKEVSKTLQREMKKRQIGFWVNHVVARVEERGDSMGVILEPSPWSRGNGRGKAAPQELEADRVLVCAGRVPAASKAGLDQVGVKTDEAGWIQANERMETTVADVYAVGDALGPSRPMLAHVATREGSVAAENALGGQRFMSYDAVPGAIFTFPEVGHVGLTETQAEQQGYAVHTERMLFRNLGKAQAIGEIAGEAKVVWDGDTGKVLGVHLVGPHATDLIAEATLALQTGCTIVDLAETVHAHPTLAEIMPEVSLKAVGRPLHG
jgi:dihydrolipoamide dehydrogenase